MGGTSPREVMESAAEDGSDRRVDIEDSSLGSNDTLQFYRETQSDNFMLLVMWVKSQSCCMGHFALKLIPKCFLSEQLQNQNCRGLRGKEKLDPVELETVEKYTFRLYPTPSGLKDQQWGKCIIAIDEFLRHKKDASVRGQ